MVGLLIGILVVLVMILERLRVIEKYWVKEKQEYVDFGEDLDELFPEALKVVLVQDRVSASLLQRKLSIGYARSARLLDQLEHEGLVGPGVGAKPRDVYKDKINSYLEDL